MERIQEINESSEWNRDRLFRDLSAEQSEALEQRLMNQLEQQELNETKLPDEISEVQPYQEKELYNKNGVHITEYTMVTGENDESLRDDRDGYLQDGYFEDLANGMRRRHPPRLDAERLRELPNDQIVGEPLEDLKYWHKQETPTSCAVACQDYIIDQLTDVDPTEAELRAIAAENGWYREGDGTPGFAIGALAEYYGLHSEWEQGLTVEQLQNALEQGDKIIASVDSSLLYYPENPEFIFADIIKQGCHAVQITGLDMSNPDDVKVIINDPVMDDGGANVYDWDEFKKCSEDCFFRIYT